MGPAGRTRCWSGRGRPGTQHNAGERGRARVAPAGSELYCNLSSRTGCSPVPLSGVGPAPGAHLPPGCPQGALSPLASWKLHLPPLHDSISRRSPLRPTSQRRRVASTYWRRLQVFLCERPGWTVVELEIHRRRSCVEGSLDYAVAFALHYLCLN